MDRIVTAASTVDAVSGHLTAQAGIISSTKLLSALEGVFADKAAWEAMPQDTPVYAVEMLKDESEGTPGGLFFGTSFIFPGTVGNEYFMTKGHFHEKRECAEYYWGIAGEGLLLLLQEDGTVRAERVERGSVHYIAGFVGHRLVNTGDTTLTVGACWPSDAGHDYGSIAQSGFPVRAVRGADGKPQLIKQED